MSRCEVRLARPITPAAQGGVPRCQAGGIDPSLQLTLEQGEYEVDSREVAEAIVRSWMLVAAEPRHGALRAEEEETASR